MLLLLLSFFRYVQDKINISPEEAYLMESTDLADLERRQRQIEENRVRRAEMQLRFGPF